MSVIFAFLAGTAIAGALPPQAAPQEPDQDIGDDIVVTGQRTEGSDGYTIDAQTTATRLPLTLRETPQSVSIVTRAQIEDFQLNDVNALLTTVPGINIQANETDRTDYSSRGFNIQTFQIDGIGVPFAFGIQTGSIDTAIYDHIEVVRGAPGLLSSTGNPSAVINFVRKRPTRDLQLIASAQYGSFDNLRFDADVSVPIAADGAIRARAVGAYLDTDSHLDRYGLRRWTGYGIVEADIGPNTVLSGGYGHQDHASRAAQWGSIPLTYTDGTRFEFARSSNTGPDWAHWDVIDRQIFGDLTHRLGNEWVARLSAIRRATSEDDALFYVFGNPVRGVPGGIVFGPDPTTTNDDTGIKTYPGAFRAETRNLTLEGYVTGPVTLFGRRHDIMLGINRSAQDYKQYSSYDFSTVNVLQPVETLFDGAFPRPDFPATYDLSLDRHTRRETAYGLVRLSVADPLKLMFGGNLTHAESEGVSYGQAVNFDNTRFLPFAGAVYDLSPSLSAYASYATIFNPQVEIDTDNRVLEPIRGNNLEAGLKGSWYDGRLNATVAVFRTRQDNTAEFAGFVVDPVTGIGRNVYIGVDAKAEGIELEFGGQLLPGLQATGGFTALRIEDADGDRGRTYVPRNTARLNLSYSPPALDALKLGVSAQYQSRIYSQPNATTRITQGAYALVDLLARYDLTQRVSLSANLRNVTNARYLSGLTFDQGYYGAPRSVLGTVTVRY